MITRLDSPFQFESFDYGSNAKDHAYSFIRNRCSKSPRPYQFFRANNLEFIKLYPESKITEPTFQFRN